MADRYRIRSEATQAIAEAKAEYQLEATKDGVIDPTEKAILYLMDRAYLTSEVADEAQAIAVQALCRPEGPNQPLRARHRSLGELIEAWVWSGKKCTQGDQQLANRNGHVGNNDVAA